MNESRCAHLATQRREAALDAVDRFVRALDTEMPGVDEIAERADRCARDLTSLNPRGQKWTISNPRGQNLTIWDPCGSSVRLPYFKKSVTRPRGYSADFLNFACEGLELPSTATKRTHSAPKRTGRCQSSELPYCCLVGAFCCLVSAEWVRFVA